MSSSVEHPVADYFQENRTSRRPFLLLRSPFSGRPIFIQFVPDEDDGVEDDVGDGEVLGAVLHGEGAGAAAEVVQSDAHLGKFGLEVVVKKRANGSTLVALNVPWMDGMKLFVSNKCP